jgi:superfamily II DNA or RNA helicase
MTRIVVGNVWSKIEDISTDHLRIVRHGVAYQEQVMPTLDAQRTIKAFFSRSRRYGSVTDLRRLWADSTVSQALTDADLAQSVLTPAMLERVLRQRGIWDGWVRMVKGDGSFPTGLLALVRRQLRIRCETPFALDDNRGDPPCGTPLPTPDLYAYQREAVEAFVQAGRGVIDLPPRSGKTRIAMAIVAQLGVPTLYVTPAVGLVTQTVAAFREFFPDRSVFGQRGKPNAKERRQLLNALVWVATPQTAITLPNLHARQLLVLDEFHHAAAATWQAVSEKLTGAYWRLGLTGTHYRADGRDMEMAGVLGRSAFSRSVSEMVELGRLVPARIAMLRCPGSTIADNKTSYRIGVVENGERNAILASAATTLIEAGCRVLVLTKQIGHAEVLAGMIPGAVEVDGRDNEVVDERLRQLSSGVVPAVVGTSVIGEGRDVPAADALVYAAGGKSRVKVKQDYFRVLTESRGKRTGIIVDVVDLHHPKLLEHSVHRMMLYREEDCFESSVLDVPSFKQWLGRQ